MTVPFFRLFFVLLFEEFVLLALEDNFYPYYCYRLSHLRVTKNRILPTNPEIPGIRQRNCTNPEPQNRIQSTNFIKKNNNKKIEKEMVEKEPTKDER